MSTLETITETVGQYVDRTAGQLRSSFMGLGKLLAQAIDDRDCARELVRQCQRELERVKEDDCQIDFELLEALKNEIRRWDAVEVSPGLEESAR